MLFPAICLLSIAASAHLGTPHTVSMEPHAPASTPPSLLERMEWMGFIPLASGLPGQSAHLEIGEQQFMTIGADGAFALHMGKGTAPFLTGMLLPVSHDDTHYVAILAPQRGPAIRAELTPWTGSPTGIIVRTMDIGGVSAVAPPLVIDDFYDEEMDMKVGLLASVDVPIIIPPRRGRRYCVCLYELPDTHTTDFAPICSVFDCDNGKRCTPEAGLQGRCMWVRGSTDDVGTPWAATLTVMALAAVLFRRRQ